MTCPRPEWKSLQAVRLPKAHRLPVILSREQVRRLIATTRLLQFRVFFQVCYTCGLRLGDAKQLRPGDIDAQRGQIIVRNSKGGKDRVVPVPTATIELLRTYWKTHGNRRLIFPSLSNRGTVAMTTQPMSDRSVQRAYQLVVQELNFAQAGIRLHTLRHSYATHLLDDGVNLKVLQQYLGHTSLQTTEIYLQLTQQGDEHARSLVERLLEPPSAADPAEDSR